MPTTAAKAAKSAAPKTAKTTKAAPAKKAAVKKAAKATKPKASPVATFTDAYRAYYRSSVGLDEGYVKATTWRAARVMLCTLAGCTDPGPGHALAHCRIKAEITGLMASVQRAQYPASGLPDRTGAAATVLTDRLSELTA